MQSARGFAHVLVCLALLTGSSVAAATAGPFSRSTDITIRNDRGGLLVEYAVQRRAIERSGRRIRFAGKCLSACTIYLSVSKSCISRGASFGFHLPYGSSKNGNVHASNFMVRSYPGWVRNWISANGGLRQRMKVMPYEYAARYIPACSV
jgi:hypothetical protein